MLAERKLIFVSHSREDGAVVNKLQEILGLGLSGISRDCEISRYLGEADVLMVFWSRGAAAAESVRKDYLGGIGMGKQVVPVCLDDLPLPGELAAFQAISCEGFARAEQTGRWRALSGYIAAALAVVLVLALALQALPLLQGAATYYFPGWEGPAFTVCAVLLAGIAVAAWRVLPTRDKRLTQVQEDLRGEFRRLVLG